MTEKLDFEVAKQRIDEIAEVTQLAIISPSGSYIMLSS